MDIFLVIFVSLFYMLGIHIFSFIFANSFNNIDKFMKRTFATFWPLAILFAILNLPFYLYQKRIDRMRRWNEGASEVNRAFVEINMLYTKLEAIDGRVLASIRSSDNVRRKLDCDIGRIDRDILKIKKNLEILDIPLGVGELNETDD